MTTAIQPIYTHTLEVVVLQLQTSESSQLSDRLRQTAGELVALQVPHECATAGRGCGGTAGGKGTQALQACEEAQFGGDGAGAAAGCLHPAVRSPTIFVKTINIQLTARVVWP